MAWTQFYAAMMTSLDTLEIAKRLRSAGFDDTQAEAITGALRDTREADLSRLATKEDLSAVEARLTIRLGGMIVIAAGFLAAIKFFG
jgi:hypothetical protein